MLRNAWWFFKVDHLLGDYGSNIWSNIMIWYTASATLDLINTGFYVGSILPQCVGKDKMWLQDNVF